MHRVTFDSNVWRKVVTPSKFSRDSGIVTYRKINAACSSGQIAGFISETTLTIEQIKRDDRLAWLKSAANVSVTEPIASDGSIRMSISIGSSNSVEPVVIKMVQEHLDDAYSIGIRVLRSKRIAGPSSELLKDDKYFLKYASDKEFHLYNNKNGEVMRQLENMGVGIANIKSKGVASGSHWIDGIKALSDSEKNLIAEMVAEWADADAVAASIAHDVEYFCTNDIAKASSSKGVVSAMSAEKSQAITTAFRIKFVSPDALCRELGL